MTPQTIPLACQTVPASIGQAPAVIAAAHAASLIPNASVPQSPSRLDAETGLAGLHEKLEALKMEQDRREDMGDDAIGTTTTDGKDEIPIDTLKGLAEALGKVIHADGRETTPMPPDHPDLTDASTVSIFRELLKIYIKSLEVFFVFLVRKKIRKMSKFLRFFHQKYYDPFEEYCNIRCCGISIFFHSFSFKNFEKNL